MDRNENVGSAIEDNLTFLHCPAESLKIFKDLSFSLVSEAITKFVDELPDLGTGNLADRAIAARPTARYAHLVAAAVFAVLQGIDPDWPTKLSARKFSTEIQRCLDNNETYVSKRRSEDKI